MSDHLFPATPPLKVLLKIFCNDVQQTEKHVLICIDIIRAHPYYPIRYQAWTVQRWKTLDDKIQILTGYILMCRVTQHDELYVGLFFVWFTWRPHVLKNFSVREHGYSIVYRNRVSRHVMGTEATSSKTWQEYVVTSTSSRKRGQGRRVTTNQDDTDIRVQLERSRTRDRTDSGTLRAWHLRATRDTRAQTVTVMKGTLIQTYQGLEDTDKRLQNTEQK